MVPVRRMLIYVTSLSFPARYANQIQTLHMARAFAALLGDQFLLCCPRGDAVQLAGVPCRQLRVGLLRRWPNLQAHALFFWIAAMLYGHRDAATGLVLYVKDTRLAAFACFWRRYLCPSARVVLETHIPFPSLCERYALSRADHIVTITGAMSAILQHDSGVSERRITVLPDAVDLTQFEFSDSAARVRADLRLPISRPIAMYAGSVGHYDWKGEDVFIAAAELLSDGWVFVLVGGDAEDARRAFGGPLPSNLLCVGRRAHTDVPRFLRAANVLVLPNKSGNPRSATLTSPLKLFEYMASGVPIVASNLPALREIIDDQCAWLVPPDRPASLAAGIVAAHRDEARSRALATCARHRVERHQWTNRAMSVLNVLADRNPARARDT